MCYTYFNIFSTIRFYKEVGGEMTRKQVALLILISSLWGSSFIFMKVLSPVFGPILVSSLRLLGASLFLYIYMRLTKMKISFKRNILFFMTIGIINSAIPFVMYSFAALNIDASLSGTLNSSSPMFGAIFGYLLLGSKLKPKQIIGLIVGFIGVLVVSSASLESGSVDIVLSVIACILAAACYGLAGTFVKRRTTVVDSSSLTLGSLFFAGIFLLPFSFFYDITSTIELNHIFYMIFFAIMCTAIPFIIYYQLIKEVGAVKALMVTYLMPLFTVLWSYIFLAEKAGINVYFGLIIILIGVYLISNKSFKQVL